MKKIYRHKTIEQKIRTVARNLEKLLNRVYYIQKRRKNQNKLYYANKKKHKIKFYRDPDQFRTFK